jgi:hypothetical protein
MIAVTQILLPIISIVALVSFIFLLVASFKRHIGWGLAVLLVPFAIPVYGIKYWREVKKPFVIYMVSNTVCLALVMVYFNTLGGFEIFRMAQSIDSGTMTEQEGAQFMMTTMEGLEKATGENFRESALAEMRQDGRVSEEQLEQMEHMFDQIEGLATGEIESLQDDPWKKAEPGTSDTPSSGSRVSDPEVDADPVPASAATARPPPMPATISAAEAGRHIGRFMLVTTKSGIKRKGVLSEVKGGKLVFAQLYSGGALEFTLDPTDVESLKLNVN